jgi:hypothetical protein
MWTVVVAYNSKLPKKLVAPELSDQLGLWLGTPSIPSEPIRIEITQ